MSGYFLWRFVLTHGTIYLHPPMVSQLLIRRKVLLYGKARAHKKNSCTSKTFYDGRRLSCSVESNCLIGAGRRKTYPPPYADKKGPLIGLGFIIFSKIIIPASGKSSLQFRAFVVTRQRLDFLSFFAYIGKEVEARINFRPLLLSFSHICNARFHSEEEEEGNFCLLRTFASEKREREECLLFP